MGLVSPKKRVRNKSTGRNYAVDEKYESTPKQKKRRAERNAARHALMKKGVVHKGDGLDVDHINSNPNDNVPANWRAIPKSQNRSYPRTKTAREKKRPGIITT